MDAKYPLEPGDLETWKKQYSLNELVRLIGPLISDDVITIYRCLRRLHADCDHLEGDFSLPFLQKISIRLQPEAPHLCRFTALAWFGKSTWLFDSHVLAMAVLGLRRKKHWRQHLVANLNLATKGKPPPREVVLADGTVEQSSFPPGLRHSAVIDNPLEVELRRLWVKRVPEYVRLSPLERMGHGTLNTVWSFCYDYHMRHVWGREDNRAEDDSRRALIKELRDLDLRPRQRKTSRQPLVC